MEMKPITISFKQTDEEIALYEIIIKHTSKGSFIKDTLIATLLNKSKNISEIKINQNIEDSNDKNDELNEIFDM